MAANQRHCPGHGRCTTPNDRAWDVSNVTDQYVRATSWYAVVLVYDGWLKRWHLQTFGALKMNLRTFHRNSTIPLAALSRIMHHVYNSIVISVASAAQWSALHLNLTNLCVAIHLCYSWRLLWVPTSWKVSNVAKKDKHLENPRNDKKYLRSVFGIGSGIYKLTLTSKKWSELLAFLLLNGDKSNTSHFSAYARYEPRLHIACNSIFVADAHCGAMTSSCHCAMETMGTTGSTSW